MEAFLGFASHLYVSDADYSPEIQLLPKLFE